MLSGGFDVVACAHHLMQDGWTALMDAALIEAAQNGHLEVAELLIRHGAHVQYQDEVIWGRGYGSVPVWAKSFV